MLGDARGELRERPPRRSSSRLVRVGAIRASGISVGAAIAAARCGMSAARPQAASEPAARRVRRSAWRTRSRSGSAMRSARPAVAAQHLGGERRDRPRRRADVRAVERDRADRRSAPRRAGRCAGRPFEDRVAEVAADLGRDLGGEVGAGVVHRQDDPLDREIRVQVVADEIDGRDELAQALEGVVLALDRDEDGVGGGERVHGQEPERGRAVEEDVVVAVADRLEESCEAALALAERRELDLRAGERDRRRHEREPVDRRRDDQLASVASSMTPS